MNQSHVNETTLKRRTKDGVCNCKELSLIKIVGQLVKVDILSFRIS